MTQLLSNIEHLGINAVELGSIHPYEADLSSALKKFNMDYLVHNYFPPLPIEQLVLNIASRNKNTRKRSMDHIKSCITFCAEIAARLYTFHPGFVTDPDGESLSTANYDFQFAKESPSYDDYHESYSLFLEAVQELIEHAHREGIPIAIETQGSVAQASHLLLQQPDEFNPFINTFAQNDVGLNINLGHLNLASQTYGFDRFEFINQVIDHIVALEISHNDGWKDDHAVLKPDEWYWDIIMDNRLCSARKVVELRNTSIEIGVSMVRWIEKSIEQRGIHAL